MTGGLAMVSVVASMFFAGISGSAAADSAAVGSVMIPAMVRKGYHRDFAAALIYPDNIGVGRPNHPLEADAQYWRGKALQGLGRMEEAQAAWKEGAAGSEGRGEQNKYRQLCQEALKGS